jgi:hypothetical protein
VGFSSKKGKKKKKKKKNDGVQLSTEEKEIKNEID